MNFHKFCLFCRGHPTTEVITGTMDERLHFPEEPYTCDVCKKTYQSKLQLAKHMLSHPGEEKPFTCKTCQESFRTKNALKKHRPIHGGMRQFVCEVCSKAFKYNLILIHTGGKALFFQRHPTAEVLTGTMDERLHFPEEPYTCDVCKKTYQSKLQLAKHMLSHPGEEKPFTCESCQESFRTKIALKKHRPIHGGMSQFVCEVCNKVFKHNLTLNLKTLPLDSKVKTISIQTH
ncbi:hypothetical protein JTE90_003694 [Oedothorax gibbosus]|uniref:C2H2-type domain-containing protein n=1 Tax=Oedothorax gibbosus TaxID=931172 RepID=A0AAV6VUY8_9ARAC|nr:hypothetical protein JTE90_003694 [Oedothorax gibbosus]